MEKFDKPRLERNSDLIKQIALDYYQFLVQPTVENFTKYLIKLPVYQISSKSQQHS